MTTLLTRGLSAGSLYKVLFVGLFFPLFVFGLGCGIASYFGYSTVTINDQYVYGTHGLIGGIVIGLVLPILMAAFLWVLLWIGTWVWTSVKRIHLTLKD